LPVYSAIQNVGLEEDIQVFGYGGLRSGEGGKDLANASLATAQVFEQLQTGGIGQSAQNLQAQFRDILLSHD
jgi:hypothetical protein